MEMAEIQEQTSPVAQMLFYNSTYNTSANISLANASHVAKPRDVVEGHSKAACQKAWKEGWEKNFAGAVSNIPGFQYCICHQMYDLSHVTCSLWVFIFSCIK